MTGIYVDVNMDELGASSGQTGVTPDEQEPGAVGTGPLLEERDPATLFAKIHRTVTRQERLAKNREAADTHWARVRRGNPFSALTKSEDRAIWKAELLPGTRDQEQPIPNKADDLCNKIVAQLMVDLPKPDPKPETDDDTAKAAADLARQFLEADGDESGTNDARIYRDCLDLAMTRAAAFTVEEVDPTGGGWRPLQIMAHPDAVDPAQPLVGPDGNPTTDPILRYVTDAGQFTENPAEASRQWLPKHVSTVLLRSQVRTVPETETVETAEQVVAIRYATLGRVKRLYPGVADLSPTIQAALCQWRPERAKALIPSSLRGKLMADDQRLEKGGVPDDATLVFWYHWFHRVCEAYPDGAALAVNGANGGVVLAQETLRDDVEGPDGTVVPILRDIPIAQLTLIADSEDRDPMGRAMLERFGGANAMRANLYGSVIESTDQSLHPHWFTTATSPVQDWQWLQRGDKSIPVLSKEDIPTKEEPNALPTFLPRILELIDRDMEVTASLGDTSQGLETSNAVSGIAKQTVLQQAKVALEQPRQNFLSFAQRRWRLKLQLAQAKLTIPQLVKYVGDNQAYKATWWTGADFVGVQTVAVQPGTGTLMSPSEKQQYASFAQQAGFLDPDEARDVARSTATEDLGVEGNVHEQRIQREITTWQDGPPENWQPSQPQVDPVTQQPVVDPTTGQPAMTAPTWSPFGSRPHDEEPGIAKARHKALSRFMATGEYLKQPMPWRQVLDAEYARMAYAAGIVTVRQQAAQAQQQQAGKDPDGDPQQDGAAPAQQRPAA